MRQIEASQGIKPVVFKDILVNTRPKDVLINGQPWTDRVDVEAEVIVISEEAAPQLGLALESSPIRNVRGIFGGSGSPIGQSVVTLEADGFVPHSKAIIAVHCSSNKSTRQVCCARLEMGRF